MSFEAVNWAYQQQVGNAGRKFVLVTLADHADGNGVCFPGKKSIAKRTEQAPDTVRKHLRWLEENDFLTCHERVRSNGSQTSNEYHLNLSKEGGGAICAPPSNRVGGGRKLTPGEGGRNAPPLTVSSKSSINRQSVKDEKMTTTSLKDDEKKKLELLDRHFSKKFRKQLFDEAKEKNIDRNAWLELSLDSITSVIEKAKPQSQSFLTKLKNALDLESGLTSESRDIPRGASVPGQGPPKLESLDLERRLELRATHVKRSYTSALESKLNASDSLESASAYARNVALEAWAISSEDHELDREEDEFEYVISSAGTLARQAIKMRSDTEKKLMNAGLRSEASSWGLAAYQHTLSENHESLLELQALIQKRIQGVRLKQGLAKDAYEVVV